jgi:hypothetical protein
MFRVFIAGLLFVPQKTPVVGGGLQVVWRIGKADKDIATGHLAILPDSQDVPRRHELTVGKSDRPRTFHSSTRAKDAGPGNREKPFTITLSCPRCGRRF